MSSPPIVLLYATTGCLFQSIDILSSFSSQGMEVLTSSCAAFRNDSKNSCFAFIWIILMTAPLGAP
eukprot:Pgem_evm1s19350